MGSLYYGDNLEILRRYIRDETVDFAYLDPPFNSARNFNTFFHERMAPRPPVKFVPFRAPGAGTKKPARP